MEEPPADEDPPLDGDEEELGDEGEEVAERPPRVGGGGARVAHREPRLPRLVSGDGGVGLPAGGGVS